MSDWELWFFIIYLSLQICIPLLRYAKFIWRPKQSNLYGDYFWFFCWTMKLKATTGYVEIRIFDRETNDTILESSPEKTLPKKQYRCLFSFPTTSIQYAKYLEKKFDLEEKNYGLNLRVICDLNCRGPVQVVDDQVDFTKEKIKRIGAYEWYLDD